MSAYVTAKSAVVPTAPEIRPRAMGDVMSDGIPTSVASHAPADLRYVSLDDEDVVFSGR
jgi:hypothetical protein